MWPEHAVRHLIDESQLFWLHLPDIHQLMGCVEEVAFLKLGAVVEQTAENGRHYLWVRWQLTNLPVLAFEAARFTLTGALVVELTISEGHLPDPLDHELFFVSIAIRELRD